MKLSEEITTSRVKRKGFPRRELGRNLQSQQTIPFPNGKADICACLKTDMGCCFLAQIRFRFLWDVLLIRMKLVVNGVKKSTRTCGYKCH